MDCLDAPAFSSLDHVCALRADLMSANFNFDSIVALVGQDAMDALIREQPVPARRAVERVRQEAFAAGTGQAPEARLATLVLVFVLGGSSDAAEMNTAVPSLGVEGLAQLGLVEQVPPAGVQTRHTEPMESTPASWSIVRAKVDLRPHAADDGMELWVASDVGAHHRDGALRHDHVLGIGQASLTLASITIRRPVRTALDVGVGCGIQTFHLLKHAEHVTATDLSARALSFTRFNLLLNYPELELDPQDLDARVRLVQGSLLEPVEGETFDLVVSNPPFVITPRSPDENESERFTYRDGGLPGDQLVESLWRSLPQALAPGGTVHMLANWEIPTGAHWAQRLDAWTPQELEAWVIQRDVETPQTYAELWLQDAAEDRDRAVAQARYGQYLDDFASRDVEGIGFGYVWLRKPANQQRAGVGRVFEEILREVDTPLAPWLAREIDAADRLVAENVAHVHAVAADDVTVESHARPGDEHPQVILLRQGSGLRRTHAMTSAQAGLISACDGDAPVGLLADAVVQLLGEKDPGAEGQGTGGQGPQDDASPSFGRGPQPTPLVDFVAMLLRQGLLEWPQCDVREEM